MKNLKKEEQVNILLRLNKSLLKNIDDMAEYNLRSRTDMIRTLLKYSLKHINFICVKDLEEVGKK